MVSLKEGDHGYLYNIISFNGVANYGSLKDLY